MARSFPLFLLFMLTVAFASAQKKGYDPAFEKKIQTQLILAEDGSTIELPAGIHEFRGSLSLDGKKNITLKGAGMGETVLSFKRQTEGAEGLKITNCENLTLLGFTVMDSKGDAIKVQSTDGLTFRDVKTDWSGRPKKTNGSYGFYPVQCKNVLIEDCHARGASDAGIYVGQSREVVVRRCKAWGNVAGIEIENCIHSEVYDCIATDNTGGILIFDMPGLTIKNGGYARVYNNKCFGNNFKNFAPKGNIVGKVPPGTGMMIMSGKNIEIYGNEIKEHKTVAIAIISWFITEEKYTDSLYDPYPYAISIHDNVLDKKNKMPALSSRIGKLLFLKFKRKVPAILWDGILPPDATDENGQTKEAYRICIQNNEGTETFANIDAEHNFKDISHDLSPHDCKKEVIWTKKE